MILSDRRCSAVPIVCSPMIQVRNASDAGHSSSTTKTPLATRFRIADLKHLDPVTSRRSPLWRWPLLAALARVW